MNFFNLIDFLQCLCRVWIYFLLSLDMYPVWEPTSNGTTFTVKFGFVSKCEYFWYFKSCAIFSLCSAGTVNSKIVTDFFCLSITTMSGFSWSLLCWVEGCPLLVFGVQVCQCSTCTCLGLDTWLCIATHYHVNRWTFLHSGWGHSSLEYG